jgi:hypothetical protein
MLNFSIATVCYPARLSAFLLLMNPMVFISAKL